jgi:hypothetical protein
MITVKGFMELVEYRVTEGDSYLWKCFGDSAFSLSAWNGDHDGWSMNMVFDTKDQTVYVVEVCDYARDRAYRMINPNYKMVHDAEALSRGVDYKEAWDDVNYVDLDTDDDFIEKAQAIRDGEDYDTRVDVPLTVPDDVLFELMKRAHEQDITLNQLVEQILWTAIEDDRINRELQETADDLKKVGIMDSEDDDSWDDLAEDDHWDDDIIDDEPVEKKKKKKSK